MSHPLFEIVTTTAGAVSIRNKAVNEIMHNPVGPWVEANLLYVDQSNLKERFLASGFPGNQFPTIKDEFVVFDVGLGAAANSLAALTAVKSLGKNSLKFKMISFEKDLELLRFALDHSQHFEHFSGYEDVLRSILSSGEWHSGPISWHLRVGDFLQEIETEKTRPDIIFFDPYSPKVNQEMWSTESFKKLKALSRTSDEGGTSLYTYSQATCIRAAMIAAGFFVGYGVATGLKKTTTEAATSLQLLRQPLGQEWFERWQKSHLRYPYGCLPAQEPEIDEVIEKYFFGTR